MKFLYINIFILLFLLVAKSEGQQRAQEELLKQANNYISQLDYINAKQSLKSYQILTRKKPALWLEAQHKLISILLEEKNLKAVDTALKAAEKKVNKNKLNLTEIDIDIKLLKAEVLEIKNNFADAEKIYDEIIAAKNTSRAKIPLANNLVDRLLGLKSLDKVKDQKKLNSLLIEYEESTGRNPLELIRVKQKNKISVKIDKDSVKEFNKYSEYWIRKDEFAILSIYLLIRTAEYDTAYKKWVNSNALFTKTTHTFTVDVLSQLSSYYLKHDHKKSTLINNTLSVLIRDAADREIVNTLLVEQSIAANQLKPAQNQINQLKRQFPKSKVLNALAISLAEAYLQSESIKEIKGVLKSIEFNTITSTALKSRYNFLLASVLLSEGKNKEAAELFFKSGQNSSNATFVANSLFKSGVAYQKASLAINAMQAFEMLLSKPKNDKTDETLFLLSGACADSKNYDKAIKATERLVKEGEAKSAKFKLEALYKKGDYYLSWGKNNEAIQAYEEFVLIYNKDERSPELLYKIYNIQRSTDKDLDRAVKTLDRIIAEWRESSPEVYSRALNRKAMILLLNGNDRESIKLWQQFLEFNSKADNQQNGEVKLLLASAYQNSEDFGNSAAVSLYLDIISNSANNSITKSALVSLLNLEIPKKSEAAEKVLDKILIKPPSYVDEETIQKIMFWKSSNLKKTELKSQKLKIDQLIRQSEKLASKKLNAYWSAYFIFQKAKIAVGTQKPRLLKAALALNERNNDFPSRILKKNLQIALKMENEALTTCLDIIYSYSALMETDNYLNWQIFHDACLTACNILISQKRFKDTERIINRLQISSLPGTQKIIEALTLKLKESQK